MAQEAKEGLPWDTGKETGASLRAALPRVPRRDQGAKTMTKVMVTAAEAVDNAAATAGQRSDDREVDDACVNNTIPPDNNEDDQQQQCDNYNKGGGNVILPIPRGDAARED
jgi:hypothetical protein